MFLHSTTVSLFGCDWLSRIDRVWEMSTILSSLERLRLCIWLKRQSRAKAFISLPGGQTSSNIELNVRWRSRRHISHQYLKQARKARGYFDDHQAPLTRSLWVTERLSLSLSHCFDVNKSAPDRQLAKIDRINRTMVSKWLDDDITAAVLFFG